MKPTMLYRIASVLLIVFVIGNIYGLSRFWQVAVLNPVRFPVGHRPLTYAQVVLGLELTLVQIRISICERKKAEHLLV
jgi:hypothetical protein